MEYRKALDRKREEQNFSVTELAEAAGIGSTTLSRIINGHNTPYKRTIHKLASVLNCNPEDIGFTPEEV